jgi:pimeloyl-ACP methyl ester carboxylesterase
MPVTRLHEHGDVVVFRTTLKLKTGRNPGGLIYFCPDRIPPKPEVLFLANGFAANHKTYTFRSRIPDGGYADSFADFLAKWGYIVMVKDVGSERTRIEPTFEDHMAHVPHYAETTLRVVAEEIPRFCHTSGIAMPQGVHWIGHSMGGMEAMAAESRAFISSLITIASPTYMNSEEEPTRRLAHIFGGVLGVRKRYTHVPVSAGLLSKVTDAMFKALQVESGRDLTEVQESFVRTMARRPFVNLVVHNFLNLEHLDLETAVAFFRTGLSDETLHLMNEFAQAILSADTQTDHVLGHPIQRLNIPTMVMSGQGDHIAPVRSCENLLNFVDHPLKRKVYFDKYDHLGLLVRHGAEDHVWPHILLFLKEVSLRGGTVAAAREARDTARFLLDNLALGIEARNYARELLANAEARLKPRAQAKPKPRKKKSPEK